MHLSASATFLAEVVGTRPAPWVVHVHALYQATPIPILASRVVCQIVEAPDAPDSVDVCFLTQLPFSSVCTTLGRLADSKFPWQDPFELMEILKKVLVFLDAKHDIDLREEPPQCNEKNRSK